MDFKEKIQILKNRNLYRRFRTIKSSCSDVVNLDNKNLIMLSSNNYFGLNTHPRVINSAKTAIDKYGSGNVASRLVVNLDIHEKLETEIAKYRKCESCLVYANGFGTNLGIIPSIVGKGDFILSDELNHASIIDGCRLSGADVKIYRHCDINDLKNKLKSIRTSSKILLVTDTIFSMDGDKAPLDDIIELKKKYNFILMADEAHSLGILDNKKEVDICMGTLSKAVCSQGGYVAAKEELIDYLRNTSRPFMFSTGLSPSSTASALEALKIIKTDKSLKKKLVENFSYLREGLRDFQILGNFQIIPLLTYNNNITMRFQEMLQKEGIFVSGIRKPSVPIPRLRISAIASHKKSQLELAINSFKKCAKVLNLAPRAQR